MNTPPTKRRNYRNSRPAEKFGLGLFGIPDGHFEWGIGTEEMLIAYGRAVSFWPLVEDAMTNVLGQLIGKADHEIASEIFHALLAQNTRLPVMLALLQNTKANEAKSGDFDEVLAEFTRLNTERNCLIHQYWFTHTETGDVYRCPSHQSMIHAMSTGTIVTAESLKVFRSECTSLVKRVFMLNLDRV